MRLTHLVAVLSLASAAPALAQDTTEVAASPEEVASVTTAIAQVNCKLGEGEVEKESATLFEIDDTLCDAGQYDIKLNERFKITSMTLDE